MDPLDRKIRGRPHEAGLRETTMIGGSKPETGSNRRRRPFQGHLPIKLSGLKTVQVAES
jgi:hypothetical protein